MQESRNWLPLADDQALPSAGAATSAPTRAPGSTRGIEQFYYCLRSRFPPSRGHGCAWALAPVGEWSECVSWFERRLGLNAAPRSPTSKHNHSTVTGEVYFVRDGSAPSKRHQLRESFHALEYHDVIKPHAYVVITIMPKHALAPPPVIYTHPAPPPGLDERELIAWHSESRALPPLERVGDAPPEHYRCHNCKRRGHFHRHCPWRGGGLQETQRERARAKPSARPTGIPMDKLRRVTDATHSNKQQLMIDADNRIFDADFSDPDTFEAQTLYLQPMHVIEALVKRREQQRREQLRKKRSKQKQRAQKRTGGRARLSHRQ